MKTRIILSILALASLTGCKGTTAAVNEVDPDKATGLVLALKLAGFDGDVSIDLNADADFYLKNSVGARSPGTSFSARGHANPGNISPEESAKILDLLMSLRVNPGDAQIEPPPDGQ